MNLAFLNNLHVVKGTEDHHHNISIEIVGNNNLEGLVDLKNPKKIAIGRGEVLINFNRNLCPSDVHNFMKILAGNYSSSYIEVKHWKNSFNPVKCAGKKITEITHKVLSYDTVLIQWRNVWLNSDVQRDSYQIKYVAYTKHQNITDEIFGEEPDCGSHKLHEITLRSDELVWEGKMVKFNLTGLQQYTKYAYIVQIEGDATDGQHKDEVTAVTSVQRFRTFLNVPSRVVNVTTVNKTSSSFVVAWDVENEELNEIEEFIIDIIDKPYIGFDKIDYCSDYDVLNYKNYSLKEYYEDDSECVIDDSCCTVCCKHRQEFKESNEIFETSLTDLTEFNSQPKKLPPPPSSGRRISTKNIQNVTIAEGGDGKPLKALTRYMLHIRACAKINKESICSDYVKYLETTRPNKSEEYDKLLVESHDLVKEDEKYYSIRFTEPELVNGIILYYVIHFFKQLRPYNDSVAHQQFCVTRSQHEENNFTFTIENFHPGNHLFRVHAVSLNGRGPKGDYIYFKVLSNNNRTIEDEFAPDETSHDNHGAFFTIAILLLFFCSVGGTSYYYRHRIRIMLNRRRNEDDQECLLLDEVNNETDFAQIAEHHESTGTVMFDPNQTMR